mmetsp:Transcript_11391/g.23475  ORF Transcript_11391/g.23475 Transcript_11391/m.23475 type:complete len:167 (-) Transcript_11391:222-722(-)
MLSLAASSRTGLWTRSFTSRTRSIEPVSRIEAFKVSVRDGRESIGLKNPAHVEKVLLRARPYLLAAGMAAAAISVVPNGSINFFNLANKTSSSNVVAANQSLQYHGTEDANNNLLKKKMAFCILALVVEGAFPAARLLSSPISSFQSNPQRVDDRKIPSSWTSWAW